MIVRRALLISAAMGSVYLATAALGGNLGKHPAVYFDYLADAFLHGRLYLSDPPVTHDLTQVDGRWYVPFPPLTAILMLPAVALLGPAAPLELPFSALFGGLNTGLVYLCLEALRQRGWTEAGPSTSLWLTGLFGLGTVHWHVASVGTVWFLAQVTTVTCLALATLLAVRRAHPLLVGSSFALAVLSRPHVVLASPFFLTELAARQQPGTAVGRRRWVAAAQLLAPAVLVAAVLLLYNSARFADAFDFGYRGAQVDPALAGDLNAHGVFHPAYVSRNAYWAFASLPAVHARFPFFTPSRYGMSIFVATPALLYLLLPPRAASRLIETDLSSAARHSSRPASTATDRRWVAGAWIAIALIHAPLLLYYSPGWHQFGYRFSLDYMVFAVCLLAARAGRRVSPWLAGLIVLSGLINLRGVVWWFARL